MNWFALPPAMEHYFMAVHPSYRPLPLSTVGTDDKPIGMIYPEPFAHLFIPVQLDGRHGQVVLHAVHREPMAELNWDLDGDFIGRTTGDHRIAADLLPGTHRLTLTDQHGRMLNTTFQVDRGRSREPTE